MPANRASLDAVTKAIGHTPALTSVDYRGTPAEALYGANVFGLAAMKAQMPKDVFRR